MRTMGACCLCVYTLSVWLLAACPVGSMSAGACLHVLWARYLRVGLDTVRALLATARCCLLRQVYLNLISVLSQICDYSPVSVLRVGLDTVKAFSATARCCLLRQVYNFCSLSTFPQVVATGMAASMGDAPDYLPRQL